MTDRATWAKRVVDWRGSGLTSEQFCAGRDFTAGGLRNAAHLVDREARGRKAPALRMARVLRMPAPAAQSPSSTPEAAVVVELGDARVAVRAGFDRATLVSVLEVLAARGGAR